jgi:ABC-type bacteriocin/lantibiotic exporter with double-glycine peptidase domain
MESLGCAFKPSRALKTALQKNSGRITGAVITNIVFQTCWVLSGLLFTKLVEKGEAKYAWALGVLLLATIVLTAVQDLIDVKLIPNLYNRMNDSFMTAIIKAFEPRRSSPNTGKIVSIFSNLYFNSVELFILIRENVIPALTSAFVGAIVFFGINPILGGVFTGAILLFFSLFVGVVALLQKHGKRSEACRLNQDDSSTDMIMNMHNIFAMNMSSRHLDSFRGNLNKCLQFDRAYLRMTAGGRSMLTTGLTLVFVACLVAIIWLSRSNRMSMAMVTGSVFILAFIREYLYMAIHRLGQLSWYSSYMSQADDDVRELLHQDDERPDRLGFITTAPTDSTILVRQAIAAERISLPDMNIKPGERVVLRGPIGSGKSTLLNVLFGKMPYTGSVTIGGVEVRNLDIATLRNIVLLVPQTVSLFQNTLYYNIAYGKPDATREQVQALLDKYNIAFAKLDDDVGRLGENLSGGQRQLVFLLRALLRKDDAKIILMDEPTSALDPKTRRVALEIIEELIGSRSAILVTHDVALEAVATQVLHLKPLID